MYDLNKKFVSFYNQFVVLSRDDKKDLIIKKNINVKRLKEGLIEYNEEFKTEYKLAEEAVIQGSVAMSTVTQNEKNQYDIDVAIVFEKDKLQIGTIAAKNMVVNALRRKTQSFNVQPEAKTNCVRINYASGYHIDFAIYRRYKNDQGNYIYEHCGSEWRERDPRKITSWFIDQNKFHNNQLRDVVRLLKMFCKSRGDAWVMPGGLIQSVLADEKFQSRDRMDERFYYTICAIRDRLFYQKEVLNPVDSTKSLKLVSKDSTKMTNLYNRLNTYIAQLDVLFKEDCTLKEAVNAWQSFFKHDYWLEENHVEKNQLQKSAAFNTILFEDYEYQDTNEFIDYLFPVQRSYDLKLDCKVTKNEKTVGWLNSMISKREPLLPFHNLEFVASTDAPRPFKVYWKVRNEGQEAKKMNCLRGQIFEDGLSHREPASFKGNHYVECYIIKDNICVAKNRIPVTIKV